VDVAVLPLSQPQAGERADTPSLTRTTFVTAQSAPAPSTDSRRSAQGLSRAARTARLDAAFALLRVIGPPPVFFTKPLLLDEALLAEVARPQIARATDEERGAGVNGKASAGGNNGRPAHTSAVDAAFGDLLEASWLVHPDGAAADQLPDGFILSPVLEAESDA